MKRDIVKAIIESNDLTNDQKVNMIMVMSETENSKSYTAPYIPFTSPYPGTPFSPYTPTTNPFYVTCTSKGI
jgi:hypothetical protein